MIEQAKIARLDAYLANNDLESVWFATPPLFAWATGGDNLVAREGNAGAAAVGYDGEGFTVLTSSIEGQRLADEELDDDITVEEFLWYESNVRDAVKSLAATPAGADIELDGFERIDASTVTQPLTNADIDRYRTLGTETASAVEAVATDAEPAHTEQELAAHLRHSLASRGIGAPVVLVGGAERVQRYRHFVPKDVPVGEYAVLTVVGVRQGQHVAVTRTVAFDEAPDWLPDRYEDTCRVAVTAAAATQRAGESGGTAADVLGAIQTAYDELGYGDEWKTHHQGGAMGYASREWIATPDNDTQIELPMAFGWNPTVPGAKSEDTILVTGDDIEVLTDTGQIPARSVEAVGFDVSVEIPGLVSRSD